MSKVFIFLGLFLVHGSLLAQAAVGTWVTIDDQSGKPRSHIVIYDEAGKLYGNIHQTLDPDADERCGTCTGKHANERYIGMEIITAAVPTGDKEWEGKIYDPETDGTYKLIMWIEDDSDVLYVRGKHWTGIYRTQTWQRLIE